MKARIKGESEWKDYKMVFNSDGVFLGLETAGYYDESKLPSIVRENQYLSAILPLECFDLWSEPDWDAYRREVAKDVLAGMLANEHVRYDFERSGDVVSKALVYAYELIRQLREK